MRYFYIQKREVAMPKKYKYRKDFTYEGKRYTVLADTQADLYMKMANKIRDLEEGRVRISGNMTVSSWIEKCIETYKPNVSDEYRSQMLQRLGKHVGSVIGKRPIKSIRPAELQDILNAQAGASDSHIKKLYQEICFVFQKAVKNHLIAEDPSDDLVRPAGYKRSSRSITEHEREHVLKVCGQDRRFVLFLLMLECGCRAKEARNVQGMDIQIVDGTRVLHIRGTKTVNADRYVPLPDDLYQLIKDTPRFQYVCLTQKGTKFTETGYKRLTERFRRELNLSMGCRTYRNALVPPFPLSSDFIPYMLRHTYCTDLCRKGVDVRTAQYLMGHADISITANIYTHIDMEQVKAAAALIAR
jgi:integrase